VASSAAVLVELDELELDEEVIFVPVAVEKSVLVDMRLIVDIKLILRPQMIE